MSVNVEFPYLNMIMRICYTIHNRYYNYYDVMYMRKSEN